VVSIADIASIVTSGATCVALIFAGLELRRSRAEDRRRRVVETEGVAVAWRPSRNPQESLEGDVRGRWVYDFTAYNPGQLPISDIVVKVSFALDIERLHYDGSTERPTGTLILTTPVLAGGQTHPWKRTLLMNFIDGRAALGETTAVISFDDPDGTRRHNHWPKLKSQN
jgi:hypothetical protein